MSYDIKTLELDKVLKSVTNYAFLASTKERILNLTPNNDIGSLNQELDSVKEGIDIIYKLGNLPLDYLKDSTEALKKSRVGSVLSGEELYNISYLVTKCEVVAKYIKDASNLGIDTTNVKAYVSNFSDNKKLAKEIENAISEDYEVKDSASMTLFKIRKRIQMEENHLRSYMNSLLLSRASSLTEPMIVLRDNRMCLPVKADSKNSFKGTIHDKSSSGTTFFIEPEEASQIYNQIEEYRADERKEVENVLKGLSLLVESHADELLSDLGNLKELDFIFAKARYSKENEYTRPLINDDRYYNLIEAAHPLISKDVVVKNTIELGNKYSTIIITGPNTGGKTVVLKLVGLVTLMALCGIFIPCRDGSSIAITHNVMADIGDEQSIEQNLSTFSSHMTRISKIFKEIDEKSLILLDEVGSGTDPKEGASLAIAIIDKLTNLNARVITTTHYGDLKVYAYNNKNIVNASVEFNQDTLAPTYKLSIGVPGASNAISISRRLGLPEDILDNAKKLVEGNTTESGKIIQKIDEENQNVIKLRESYEAKIKELENKQKKLDEELADYNKNRELMLYKAHLEANQIINDAKKKSSELLEKLNQIKDQKNIQDKDLADVKFEAKNIAAKKPENHDQHEFVVGELCHVINYGKVGQILEIKKGKYVVQVGQFKMTFNRDEIQYDKSLKKQEEIKPKRKPTVSLETQQAPMRLDLRGERYVDVATQVDLFIDRAILARYHTVYIIHGFGTGAVRKAVYEALKLNKNVKETRFGGEGEGLNGCTVVTLK